MGSTREGVERQAAEISEELEASGLQVALEIDEGDWEFEDFSLMDPYMTGTAAREARRARGQAIGRLKALDAPKAKLARRMHASGEGAATIAAALRVSRATVYRILAEEESE